MKRIQRANPILTIALILAAMLIWVFYRSGQPDRTIIHALKHGSQPEVCGAIARIAGEPDQLSAATMQEILRIVSDPSAPVFRRRYAIVAIQATKYQPAIADLLTLLEKTPWQPRDENLPSVIVRALENLGDSDISPRMARNMVRMSDQTNPDPTHAMTMAHFALAHPHRDFADPLCRLADRLAESDTPDRLIALEVTLTAMTFQPAHPALNDYLTRWLTKHPESSLRSSIEKYWSDRSAGKSR